MWEPRWQKATKRMIRSITGSVNDAADLAELFELEKQFAAGKQQAIRRLRDAGYSNRELARATGVDEKTIRNLDRKAIQDFVQGNAEPCIPSIASTDGTS